MTGINKYDAKDRRRQRRRNHIARDLGSSKYYQRIVPGRKRKWINSEDEGFYEDVRYDDPDPNP